MVIPSVGPVVLISFPFSDLSNAKLRPALVLANADKGDWILAQITSKRYTDSRAIELLQDNFISGALQVVSFIRPTKLFTANHTLIQGEVGKLEGEKFSEIITVLVSVFKESLKSKYS